MKRDKRQGLSKLPPDAIINNAVQVNRITLTFVGTVVFCVLSLLMPEIGVELVRRGLAGVTKANRFQLLAQSS